MENIVKHCNNLACDECEEEISCFNKIAGTLTGEEIKLHGLVIPDKGKEFELQATTYDLTVGEAHYIYDGHNSNNGRKWKLVFIGRPERMEELNSILSSGEKYTWQENRPQTLCIPPFGSAYVQLAEVIDTFTVAEKRNLLIVGRFDLKLSNVHQGLISQQATQIEPCYRGKIFCFIHNLSNKEIKLNYGERLATIEFSYVSCFCNKQKREQVITNLINKNKNKYSLMYCNGKGIEDIRYFYYNNRLPDDCGLLSLKKELFSALEQDEIVDRVSKKVERIVDRKSKWIPVVCSIISALALLFSAYLSNSYEKIEEEIVKIRETVNEIQQGITEEQQEKAEVQSKSSVKVQEEVK